MISIRKLDLAPDNLSDKELVEHVLNDRVSNGKSEFLPHYLQKIWIIGCLFRDDRGVKISCIYDSIAKSELSNSAPTNCLQEEIDELTTIKKFFGIIEKYSPVLVSWNGRGFDVPVLNYRSIMYGISAPSFWDQGDIDSRNKYNNYINRYHRKHIDLMDVLSNFSTRSFASLDHISRLSGFPGKLGEDGSQVWSQFLNGRQEEVVSYCETDVLNTYLVYLKYLKLSGGVNEEGYTQLNNEVVEYLVEAVKEKEKPHLEKYLATWQKENDKT